MSAVEKYIITKDDLIEVLAHELFQLCAEEESLSAIMKSKRSEFSALVGEGFNGTFEPFGVISTTATTVERATSDLQLTFNPILYHTMPASLRSVLEESKVVTWEPKIIKGQASRVVVKRHKK